MGNSLSALNSTENTRSLAMDNPTLERVTAVPDPDAPIPSPAAAAQPPAVPPSSLDVSQCFLEMLAEREMFRHHLAGDAAGAERPAVTSLDLDRELSQLFPDRRSLLMGSASFHTYQLGYNQALADAKRSIEEAKNLEKFEAERVRSQHLLDLHEHTQDLAVRLDRSFSALTPVESPMPADVEQVHKLRQELAHCLTHDYQESPAYNCAITLETLAQAITAAELSI
ncbi:hypothetical protein H696_04513 [Fonticula alba]|uniref:Uncharacterized protein n=1 Tax=Fonticula alba TaxID=691883 RepID=A0A058Z592_FONAL|nr:hypothetical protein H696_04513 [Fonticula alba]KCV69098.1 hypothetical protein H696_04513 [Fonticula alba]|eukprot:XP_009496669.1 hypothetical protein H696_04513 [Fonticula alba]